MTPHILDDGEHLTQREPRQLLIRSGLSHWGHAVHLLVRPMMGNIVLLGKLVRRISRKTVPWPDGTRRHSLAFFH